MNQEDRQPIFRIQPTGKGPVSGRLLSLATQAAARLLSLKKLDDWYCRIPAAESLGDFTQKTLAANDISYGISPADAARFPARGPALVVGNHPFGGLEGVILANELLKVRDDVKVMANYILDRIPDLRDLFIFVDPFEENRAAAANLKPLREALRWVKDGHMLAVFPAGEVSSLKLSQCGVSDPAWNPIVGSIAQRAKASVTTVFFQGRNSGAFQAAGLIHPRLRTALLPRELCNKRGTTIRMRAGGPIPAAQLARFQDSTQLTEYLRWRTYLLSRRGKHPKAAPAPAAGGKPIAAGTAKDALAQEIQSLPEAQKLITSGEFQVLVARREQIPLLMQEIGRVREISFRAVGEGTGEPLDLDQFDDYYHHLCLWHRPTNELAGGYRLGLAEEILPAKGLDGLYTHSLFKFQPRFFELARPALEMGRSFIAPAHQKSYSGLMLLWKGIAAFIAQHPEIRFLFGPVSVSNDYSPLSRQLLVQFFQTHAVSPLRGLVSPRTPLALNPRWEKAHGPFVAGMAVLDELSETVADLDGMGTPILLKQYTRLEARALTWNLDPEFGNALDCLMCADLLDVDERSLKRYLGPEALEVFRRAHEGDEPLPRNILG